MEAPRPDPEAVRAHLERVLASAVFRHADRSTALLRYLVRQTLAGDAEGLKEYTLGSEGLGRGADFDPRTDPIVRAEASRLRARLERYYQAEGTDEALRIELPKGGYVPSFSDVSRVPVAAGAASRPSRRRAVPRIALVTALATVAALAAAALTRPGPVGRPPPVPAQVEVELQPSGAIGSEASVDVAISRDGTRLVFVSQDANGVRHLKTRRLAQDQITTLEGTEGAGAAFLSPDGRWVGFSVGGMLKKMPVEGGAPVELCAATNARGASWGEDGSIVVALNPTQKLWRVPDTGGAPVPIVDLSSSSTSPVWPQVLPGAELVLYTNLGGAGADRATIEVQSLRTGTRTVLLQGGTYGRYLANGYLTYVNQGTLYAVRVDLGRPAVEGPAVPILRDVSYSRTFGYAQMDVSENGTLIYRRGAESGPFSAAWLDRSGSISRFAAKQARYNWLSLSPDGNRTALVATDSGKISIVIYDSRTEISSRLPTPPGDYTSVMWWPSGGFLMLGGPAGMSWVDPDHPERSGVLTSSRGVQVPWSVAPDGRRLAYYQLSPDTGFDLWTVPIDADGKGLRAGTPDPLLQARAFEVYPSFSPDGHWLAYASNQSGVFEVYIRRYPDDGSAEVRVSNGGGSTPRWPSAGHEIVYRTDDQRVMTAAYTVRGNTFAVGASRPWSETTLADNGVLPNFDLARDGSRIAALVPGTGADGRQARNHVTMMFNFFEVLRERARH